MKTHFWEKVAWFVISFLFFFWNEKRQKGKIIFSIFNTCLIPKRLYLYKKKQYCPQTDMENGSVVVVEVRHIFRHLSSNTVLEASATSACTRCISTMSRTKPWMREREGCRCFLGTPWKSYRPPFFMGWWPTSFTMFYDVRVCFVIIEMVVDFQGVHGRSSTVYIHVDL